MFGSSARFALQAVGESRLRLEPDSLDIVTKRSQSCGISPSEFRQPAPFHAIAQ